MREILFRGKTKKHNKTIEGSLIISRDLESGELRYFIAPLSAYYTEMEEVIPETVGEFTGLTVPSGKMFEHDIVTAKFKSNGARYNFTVKYSNEAGCYVFDNGMVKVPFNEIRSVRIIGNITDNPELLKVE
jgi:hypothetical protein